MKNIAFIGLGNMGKAIASGLVKGGAVAKENAWGYDPYREGLSAFCADTGIQPTDSATQAISHADTVLIAVKPYVIEGVLKEIKDALKGKALISVALGYDHARLSKHVDASTRVQFVMPNTPAMVGAGVMIFEGTSSLEKEERAEIMEKFKYLGVVEELPTHLMGIGGAVSGCGPAFCAMVIEALADAGVKYGLPRPTASTWSSIILVAAAVLLTAVGVFDKIAKFAGGGTLVPITGFANAIVSPAMEFKKEGFVLGLAAKMFTIAGPVLVYGITASALVGVVYYIMSFFSGGGI